MVTINFNYEREIESAIEDMRELKRGILRLGTTKTYARYFMPFLISSFHEAYPHIKIHLDEGSSLDILFRIAAGEKPDQRIRTIMARMLAQWK